MARTDLPVPWRRCAPMRPPFAIPALPPKFPAGSFTSDRPKAVMPLTCFVAELILREVDKDQHWICPPVRQPPNRSCRGKNRLLTPHLPESLSTTTSNGQSTIGWKRIAGEFSRCARGQERRFPHSPPFGVGLKLPVSEESESQWHPLLEACLDCPREDTASFVVSTYRTFADATFQKALERQQKRGRQALWIADEMHNSAGAPGAQTSRRGRGARVAAGGETRRVHPGGAGARGLDESRRPSDRAAPAQI